MIAVILSSWIWVSEHSVATAGQEVLMGIIHDVIKEMKEQMCLEEPDAVAPLTTVRRMMEQGWVWGYVKLLSRYLLILEELHKKFA